MQRGELVQDRYELEEPIGRGGMAEVWLARDLRLNRETAVKFLAPQLADNPEFLVRFFTEAQTVARISSHPAIVDVLDFGQHEGRPYLVMEYAPGGPVSDLLGRPMLPERAFEIVAEAARGLQAAHGQGLVHRDIKPGNILLDSGGRAKIADFGIAWSPTGETLTNTGAALGTPHYMPPEHISGSDITALSDIYSLGVVLYELLTGRKPFDGDNVTAVAIARVEQEPLPPSAHDPNLGPEVDALVMRCLARDPALRFPSAGDLAAALDEIGSPSEPGTGRTGALIAAAATTEDLGHPRFLTAAIAILVLLGLAGAGVALRTGADEPPSSQGRDGPPPGEDRPARAAPSPTPGEGSPASVAGLDQSGPEDAADDDGKDQNAKGQEAKDEDPADDPGVSPTLEPSGTEASPEPEETETEEEGSDDEGLEEPDPSPTPEDSASSPDSSPAS